MLEIHVSKRGPRCPYKSWAWLSASPDMSWENWPWWWWSSCRGLLCAAWQSAQPAVWLSWSSPWTPPAPHYYSCWDAEGKIGNKVGMMCQTYNAVPLWGGEFSKKYQQKTPHSLPVRARYGVSFVDPAFGWYSASVPTIINAISYFT